MEATRKRKINDDTNEPNDSSSSQVKRSRCTQEDSGRAGRIQRIYLKNFMCHGCLEIDLNLNTNFIVGRNGSGKSAVLTALIIGLGGKARDTSRGASLKAFVKVGERAADIEIVLTNTGPMAYNPRVFGREITVVRHFSDMGTTNSYKLKNAAGEVVATTFHDVQRMADALNIHVDNPVCILNQDVARTFLNTADPIKLYVMFMKATNLELVKAQYKLALRNKQQTATSLATKQKALRELEQEVMKWLKKYKSFDRTNEMEARKQSLEIEAVWAHINIIEAELKSKEEAVESLNAQLAEREDLERNKETRKAELAASIEQARQQLLQIRNEEEANQAAVNVKKGQLNGLKESLLTKTNEIRSVESAISRHRLDCTNIEHEISNSSANEQRRIQQIQERDAQLQLQQRRQKEIGQLLETAENDLSQARSALARKQLEKSNIEQDLEHNVGKIRQRQAKIRAMKQDESNTVNVYGAHMQRVLQRIGDSKEQFQQLPRGPLGSYLKLKDRRWALAIEDYISAGMLMSFCVDNHADAKVLSSILDEVCPARAKPTIICSKFFSAVHDYHTNKVEVASSSSGGCVPLIDALHISEPVVANCLIDQLNIETVLLVPTGEHAMQLMAQAARVPCHCTRAVTLLGDQFYPDPNYRSYACKSKSPRFLQVSTADVIRVYEDELRTLKQDNAAIVGQSKAVAADVVTLSKEVDALQLKISKFYRAQSRLHSEINDLKLQQVPPEPPNLAVLTEELAEIKRVIVSKETEMETLRVSLQQIQGEITSVEDECSSLKQVSRGLEARMTPIMDQITESEALLKKLSTNAKHHTDKMKQCRALLADAKKEHNAKARVLQGKTEEAQKLGPRVRTDRPLAVVLAELNDVKQQLQEVSTTVGNRLLIAETFMRLQAKYERTRLEVQQVEACLAQVARCVESRARYYQQLLEYIGIRVREMFAGVLKLRQFKGTIDIDHEKQALSLVVIPQHGPAAHQPPGRVHILSGGERSYATVAFLHALWQVMEYPFYFLDEFDVFMDKVNRRTVLDILQEHAKEHPDLQFVFLTPQDISSVVHDPNITVHRMEDPHRRRHVDSAA